MDFNEGADSFLEWAPVMMTSCLGNPSHAPCLKLKKKPAFAHELLYPPFKLDPPKFIANITANSDRYMAVIWAKALKTDKTVTAIQERAWTDDGGSAYYLNLNGKVSALPRFFASIADAETHAKCSLTCTSAGIWIRKRGFGSACIRWRLGGMSTEWEIPKQGRKFGQKPDWGR